MGERGQETATVPVLNANGSFKPPLRGRCGDCHAGRQINHGLLVISLDVEVDAVSWVIVDTLIFIPYGNQGTVLYVLERYG